MKFIFSEKDSAKILELLSETDSPRFEVRQSKSLSGLIALLISCLLLASTIFFHYEEISSLPIISTAESYFSGNITATTARTDKTPDTPQVENPKAILKNKQQRENEVTHDCKCPSYEPAKAESGFAFTDLLAKHKGHLLGIDVSHYQGRIDWKKARADGVAFAYIKASEGIEMVDECFGENWSASSKNDILRGAYHIFHPEHDGIRQAKHFLSLLASIQHDLPPAIDLESSIVTRRNVKTVVRRAKDWLEYVEKETGRKPIIYAGRNVLKNIFKGRDYFPGYRLWFAEWKSNKARIPKKWPEYTFWQIANDVSLSGSSRPIDVNVFKGTKENLIELSQKQ